MTVKQTIEVQEAGDSKRNGETRASVNEMDINLCEMIDETAVGLKEEVEEAVLNDDLMITDEEEIEVDSKTDMGIVLIDLIEETVKIDSTETVETEVIEETEVGSEEGEIEVDLEVVIEEVSGVIVEVEADSETLEIMIGLNVKLISDRKIQMIGESRILTVNQSMKMTMEVGVQLQPKIYSQPTPLETQIGVNLQNHSQYKVAGELSLIINL